MGEHAFFLIGTVAPRAPTYLNGYLRDFEAALAVQSFSYGTPILDHANAAPVGLVST